MFQKSMQEKFNKLKDKKNLLILGIETSCDETSIALVKNGREVLSNIVSSQVDIHERFGGVVPEVASRNHLLAIGNVLEKCLKEANVKLADIDAIAVTYGAGLAGALMVGVSYAKALAYACRVPLIAVNHIKAHISANYIIDKDLQPPFIALVVSGGHTALVRVDDYVNQTLISTTHDDAVGESYDKVAKVLGLGYPGGPKVDKLAKLGKANIEFIKNKTPNNLSFSYSGLKTAVINYVHKLKQTNESVPIEDICASFQQHVVSELVEKSLLACKKYKLNTLVIAGGVSANSYLRELLKKEGKKHSVKVIIPPFEYCTDNATMVASEGYFLIKNGVGLADLQLTADSSINLKYSNQLEEIE